MDNPLYINELLRYYRYHHQNDYVFGGHSHTFWEINIVAKGLFEVTYDDTIITLKENMLMIYEADIFHRSRVISSDDAEVFVYHFITEDIPRDKKVRIYELNKNDVNLVNIIAEEAERNAKNIINHSLPALTADEFNYQTKKLLEILLIRLINDEKIPDLQKHPEEKLYNTAISHMKNNMEKNITIYEIAKNCHTSETQLKTIFKKFTGNGVISHFSHMKINAAKRLLKEGLSVGEVSEILGYSSQAYMSLCFKKETGMTPLQYKKIKI